MRLHVFLILSLSCIAGCATETAPDDEQIRAALIDQLHAIEAMTNQGYPPEKANALYLEYFSAQPMVLPFGGELLVGKEAIGEFYDRVFSMGKVISNAYTEPTIGIADGYVVRVYQGTAEFQPTGSDEVSSFTNLYTDVMVYEESGWKIQWHSWVTIATDNQ